MHEPYEETEDKYLVEVSALPGCKAWVTALLKHWITFRALPPRLSSRTTN